MKYSKHSVVFGAAFLAVIGCGTKQKTTASNGAMSMDLTSPTATQFIRGDLDLSKDTITVPLYEGALADGRSVWYILTDASSKTEAERLGVEYAPDLGSAVGHGGVRQGSWNDHGTLTFAAGTVDFKPEHQLTPGNAPNFFPPTQFQPGSVGDADYSPFVQVTTNGVTTVYSAPMLAFDEPAASINFCAGSVDYTKVHDHVAAICPAKNQATIRLSHGFANSHELVYFSFDTNNQMAATMEASTYAPALSTLANTSTALDIFAVANGETGVQNPNRQGLDSALSGDGSPLNVLDGEPSSASGYSPLWSLNLAEWTDAAIAAAQRHRLISAGEFRTAVSAGFLTGPGGGEFGATGILINCPVVAIVNP